jgi:hypothetical protein
VESDDEPDLLENGRTITVFGLEDVGKSHADRSLFWRPEEMRFGRGEVPARVLRRRVKDFIASMADVLDGLSIPIGEFSLEQVTIAAEVSAKGRVSLLGSGGEAGGKTGLTLTFSRNGAVKMCPADESTGEEPFVIDSVDVGGE